MMAVIMKKKVIKCRDLTQAYLAKDESKCMIYGNQEWNVCMLSMINLNFRN
jgi:hypothetical protein